MIIQFNCFITKKILGIIVAAAAAAVEELERLVIIAV